MGYRLLVVDTATWEKYYGWKLFGYFDGSVLRSYQYLKSIGKVDDDMTWDYGCENDIELTAAEFVMFIDLFEKDYTDAWHNAPGWDLRKDAEYAKIEAIKTTDSNKIISWF